MSVSNSAAAAKSSVPSGGPSARPVNPLRPVSLILAVAAMAVAGFLVIHIMKPRPDTSDAQIRQFLQDDSDPKGIIFALEQLENRRARRQSISDWYPELLRLADSRSEEVRNQVALMMGEDTSQPAFRATLRNLLRGPSPLVRNSAALSLARFGDESAHDPLIAMLQPVRVAAPGPGHVESTVSSGANVNHEIALVTLRNSGETMEVRAPVGGQVRDVLVQRGDDISAGIVVAVVDPGAEQIVAVLRGLERVGYPEDLPLLSAYARPDTNAPVFVRAQVQATEKAIRARAAK